MFCKECGSLMFPDNGKYVCRQCGVSDDIGDTVEKFKTEHEEKVTTVFDENSAAYMSKMRIICPKCSHTEAFYDIRQTRAADEPETQFYRCCKCNHQWRIN
ncbi:MAG: transcription factor S [Candidatus Methanomethylophilaceae archaeon]|nr:transcription factor S [Candidatus Methanomethylophilaceae archaeon]MDY5872655.1 transcription factor S [Candidatus Methanomethylophilaceae archaeon]